VYNVTVEHDGQRWGYEQLCARWKGYCYDNEILRLSEHIPDVESGAISLAYPVYMDPSTFETYTLPAFFGGVNLSDVNTVERVGAVALAYFLDSREQWRQDVGDRWEAEMLKRVEELSKIYSPDLKVGIAFPVASPRD